METPATTPVPPELPERPEGVDRPPVWPAWFGPAGFVVAFTGTLVLSGIVAAILGVDPDDDSAAFVVTATLAQAIAFVAAAAFFAGWVSKPQLWHFGLRRVPLRPALKWAVLGIVAFYLVSAIYALVVSPDVEQKTTDELGADEGAFGLIVAGFMVMVVAPFAEEFFFRGFFFRALRSKFSLYAAAAIDGVLFGAIHYNFEGAEDLLLLPPLMLLGFIFCVVYEKTGSLFTVIGMHAFNNAVAYAAQADGGWQVSVAIGPVVLLACALAPRFLDQKPRPAPA
jgi:membrane protease YdiL (CAAX protease family)